jgi:F0F1-type ATP synthase membrane subunit b/b'
MEPEVDILYLVDRLENLIATSRRMPLVNQIILKESDILNIIEQMRTTIPDEIKQARRVIQDKERILAQAQAEANGLLARAREESEQTVNREGLLKAAEVRSHQMVRLAEEEIEQLKNEADSYVVETLRALRDHLTSVETDIGRSILSIEKGLVSLEGSTEEIDDSEIYQRKQAEGQELEPFEQSLPRRASLAADTMGGPMYIQEEDAWDEDENTQVPDRQDNSPRPGSRYESRT